MIGIEHRIQFAHHDFVLNNQRCIFWEKHQLLIVSDVHIGKSAHLRKHGFAVPNIMHQNDLLRLDQLVKHYQPKQLVVVGDLIHAGNNKEVSAFKEWIQSHVNLEIVLIKGNHDRLSPTFLFSLGIHQIYDEWIVDGVHFVHEPNLSTNVPTISGHIHPGIQLTLLKNARKSFPCFAIEGNQLILPAFSQFTGLDIKSLDKTSKYYGFHHEGFFFI